MRLRGLGKFTPFKYILNVARKTLEEQVKTSSGDN
jgi:hypothetical protein